MYAQRTNAAIDDFMGEMKCQLYVHIQKMVEKEVSLQLQKKGDKKEEKKEEEKEEEKQIVGKCIYNGLNKFYVYSLSKPNKFPL